MTARVVDCHAHPRAGSPPAAAGRPGPRASGTGRGLAAAAAVALLVVPVAGAAERPYGWLVASAAAVLVLGLVAVLGTRVRWGWLSALVAGAALVMTAHIALPAVAQQLAPFLGHHRADLAQPAMQAMRAVRHVRPRL